MKTEFKMREIHVFFCHVLYPLIHDIVAKEFMDKGDEVLTAIKYKLLAVQLVAGNSPQVNYTSEKRNN